MKEHLILLLAVLILGDMSCKGDQAGTETPTTTISNNSSYHTFQEDVDFLKKHTDILVLEEASGKGKVAVCASLQGRVMTSSSNGSGGRSYGWINRKLFESGDTLAHINVFGGEERFWLGPEGGQYSIFFAGGAKFNLDHWQTPRLIDLEPFELAHSSVNKATYNKSASLTNYSGYTFQFDIKREIEVLSAREVFSNLGLDETKSVQALGYQSTNTLTNTGQEAWQKETGLLSIWLLGMFIPSASTTVVLPFIKGGEKELGPIVNDSYFGKVPPARLKTGNGVIFFNGDGQLRSKIGLSPTRATDVSGAYDAASKTLTIVKYNKPVGVTDYVNSLWKLQDDPYNGDVVNSYNDGPPEPGAKPLGPFYELESSSPALALGLGESGVHVQTTYHFEGEESVLDVIVKKVLGVTLDEIKSAFE